MINKAYITKEYGSALFINAANLKNNFHYLQNLVKPAAVVPVLKSNAYGLGLKEIASLLVEEGAKAFFVATYTEAITLREVVKNGEIYVLHGIFPHQEDLFLKYNLIPVLNTLLQVEKWLNFAYKKNQSLKCIIHLDTGINRLGLYKEEVITLFEKFPNLRKYLDIVFVMSHLACSGIPNNQFNKVQINNFNTLTQEFFPHCKTSIAASYGIFLGKEYYLDLIRPGFSLYGSNPVLNGKNPLLPVIEFYSTVLKVNHVKKGEGIGYNHIDTLNTPRVIATISVGYSDGVFLNHSKDAGLFINNVKVPLIGRVSMDCVMVDVTELSFTIKEGDIVEIIGKNQDIDQFAGLNNTINCQALNILSLRYPRIYY